MKNLNTKQIEQVKHLNPWTNTQFHGNRKYVGCLTVQQVQTIVQKKIDRETAKYCPPTNVYARIRGLIKQSIEAKGTNYFKVLIEGCTGIYYASPVYGHSDYNKTRVFDATPVNIRIMNLFNKIVMK